MTHVDITDHEHCAGDGCQTVEHDGHVDHVHGDECHREAVLHDGHDHVHTEGDGCQTVEHDGHLDHVHDGHRHFQHGDHVHEH
ncbi:hypothetical protein [Arsenicicoccus dermatophilus]|uniref:hypothetical protein n=1 Tax=Arsenicicoccus dermatophilus TaxID=1076331 RepID=UPI003917010F